MPSTPIDQLKPRTIRGIKRLAKRIKKAEEIQYTAALNKAAQQAGFDNFLAANTAFNRGHFNG
jgi:hypothetical protein|tara:strand:- start:9372 stop:9560 length:189 start_codon:yes stop_codon:yes gene_type:complete